GDHVPWLDIVQHPVDRQRARLHPARGGDVGVPGEPEPADVGDVDLVERAETLLVVGARGAHPLAGLGVGGEQPWVVDARGIVRCCAQDDQREGCRDDPPTGLPHAAEAPGISLASAQNPCTCPTHLNGILTRATGPAATSLVSNRIRSDRPLSLALLPIPIRYPSPSSAPF